MLAGYNSDVEYEGQAFHVQTEDWGFENPYIVSRVYKSGAVVKSIKTPYSDFLYSFLVDDHSLIQEALRRQHQKILDLLLSGQL